MATATGPSERLAVKTLDLDFGLQTLTDKLDFSDDDTVSILQPTAQRALKKTLLTWQRGVPVKPPRQRMQQSLGLHRALKDAPFLDDEESVALPIVHADAVHGRFADITAQHLVPMLREMQELKLQFQQARVVLSTAKGLSEAEHKEAVIYVESQHEQLATLLHEGLQSALARLQMPKLLDKKQAAAFDSSVPLLLSGISSLVADSGTVSQREQFNAHLHRADIGLAIQPDTGKWVLPPFETWQSKGAAFYQRFYENVFQLTKSSSMVFHAFWQCTQVVLHQPVKTNGQLKTRLFQLSEIEKGLRGVQENLASQSPPWWMKALDWWYGDDFSSWKVRAEKTLSNSVSQIDTLRLQTITPMFDGILNGTVNVTPDELQQFAIIFDALLTRLQKNPGSKPLTTLREQQARFRLRFAELELAAKQRIEDLSPEAVALRALIALENNKPVTEKHLIAMGGFYQSLAIEKPTAYQDVAPRVNAVLLDTMQYLETELAAPIEASMSVATLQKACWVIKHVAGESAWASLQARATPVIGAAWRYLSCADIKTDNIALKKAKLLGDEDARGALAQWAKTHVTDEATAIRCAERHAGLLQNELFVRSTAGVDQLQSVTEVLNRSIQAFLKTTQTKLETKTINRLIATINDEHSRAWSVTECRFLGLTSGSTQSNYSVANEDAVWRFHLITLLGKWQQANAIMKTVGSKRDADALVRQLKGATLSWVKSLPENIQETAKQLASQLPTKIHWKMPHGLLPDEKGDCELNPLTNADVIRESICLAP